MFCGLQIEVSVLELFPNEQWPFSEVSCLSDSIASFERFAPVCQITKSPFFNWFAHRCQNDCVLKPLVCFEQLAGLSQLLYGLAPLFRHLVRFSGLSQILLFVQIVSAFARASQISDLFRLVCSIYQTLLFVKVSGAFMSLSPRFGPASLSSGLLLCLKFSSFSNSVVSFRML